MKSCNTRAGDESKLESGQEQQTARTEGCCVPDGGACALVSSAALRSDSAAQPAGTERKHGPLQILQQRALSEQPCRVLKGNVLSMRGWIADKRQAPAMLTQLVDATTICRGLYDDKNEMKTSTHEVRVEKKT